MSNLKNFVMCRPFTDLHKVILNPFRKSSKEVMMWRFRKSSKTFLSLLESLYDNPLAWSVESKGDFDVLEKLDQSIKPIKLASRWLGGPFDGRPAYSSTLGALLSEYEVKTLQYVAIKLKSFQLSEEFCYEQKGILENLHKDKKR